MNDDLILYGERFASRLLLGTSRYPSPSVLTTAITRAQHKGINAGTTRQPVSTLATIEQVIAAAAKQLVVALPSSQDVITLALRPI